MNWGWRETYFILSGYSCQTIGIPNTELQKYSSCLCALRVRFKSYNGGWTETDSWDVWTTQYISFNPDFRAKHWGGGGTNSRICVKPKIFSSTLIFVPSIWGVETYFWEMFIREGFTKKSRKKSGDSPNRGGVTPEPNSIFERMVFQGPHRTILGHSKHVLHLVLSPKTIAKAFNVM